MTGTFALSSLTGTVAAYRLKSRFRSRGGGRRRRPEMPVDPGNGFVSLRARVGQGRTEPPSLVEGLVKVADDPVRNPLDDPLPFTEGPLQTLFAPRRTESIRVYDCLVHLTSFKQAPLGL
jgi:hypothetical protein